MSEESEAINDETDETFADEPSSDKRKSHGPGLRLGIIVGLIAGAVVSTLFAPPTGEEIPREQTAEGQGHEGDASVQGMDADTPIARISSLIEHVRARMREASREAAVATHEAEELALARYAELTHQEGKRS